MSESVNLLMMCGIPASGKSSIAKMIKEQNDLDPNRYSEIVIVSSDDIRDKHFNSDQSRNTEVFNMVREEIIKHLSNGSDVIFDATNLSRKRRKGFIKSLPKKSINKKIYFTALAVQKDIDMCIQSNKEREGNRLVPDDVIQRMYKQFQLPVKGEGFDDVTYMTYNNYLPVAVASNMRNKLLSGDGEGLMKMLIDYFPNYAENYDLPQDSTYHTFSVHRHMLHTYYNVYNSQKDNNNNDEFEKEALLWAGILHDAGKAYCKSFVNYKGEETKYANFFNHEYVGSQIALDIMESIGGRFITKEVKDSNGNVVDEVSLTGAVANLVQFHMSLYNKDMNIDKFKKLVGDRTYDLLLELREADMKAK